MDSKFYKLTLCSGIIAVTWTINLPDFPRISPAFIAFICSVYLVGIGVGLGLYKRMNN